MTPETIKKLNAAEDAVNQLVEECTKNSPLYKQSPRAVAQVSRTGKWLLNAIKALRRDLKPHTEKEAS